MKEIYKTIITEIPKPDPEYFNIKRLTILTDIGGEWYLKNMCNTKPSTNKSRFSKKNNKNKKT